MTRQSRKSIAFIPARSGSKRLQNKNIRMLAGIPLVCHTVNAFIKADCFDKIIFSSDSDQYHSLVDKYCSHTLISHHTRTNDEAGDKVKIFDYIVNNIDSFCSPNDTFSMGLPTAPLRNSHHLREAFNLSCEQKKNVFSCVEYDFALSFAFSIENDVWVSNSSNSPMNTGNTRSQDQKNFYHPNGAIYIIRDIAKMKTQKTFYTNAIPYIMSRIDSFDIDTEDDFIMAQALLQAKKIN